MMRLKCYNTFQTFVKFSIQANLKSAIKNFEAPLPATAMALFLPTQNMRGRYFSRKGVYALLVGKNFGPYWFVFGNGEEATDGRWVLWRCGEHRPPQGVSQIWRHIEERKMDRLKFRVNAEKCDQCDACVMDCPSKIIYRQGAVPEAAESAEGVCLECQHCLAICPAGAISIFGLKPENSLPLLDGAIPSYQKMKTFVRGRRSVRQFRDEDVPSASIDELLTDLVHAPTGCNDRDLVFSVVYNRKDMGILRERVIQAIEARQKSGAVLHEFVAGAVQAYRNNGSDMLFRGAPHLLLVSPGEKARCGQEDAVLALAYFELLAQSAGLGTTWCGMIKFIADAIPGIHNLLGLASDTYFYAMMFGKPAVRYARTVQRDSSARIKKISIG
jgi:ferredoxin/nitroreductase